MRTLQILALALLATAARADIFTFTINSAAQTATMTDENISCDSILYCGGGASSFI